MLRPTSVLAVLALALPVLGPTAAAQAPVHLQVETNLPGAVLFADTLRVGPVHEGMTLAVPAGTRRLRLAPPSAEVWSVEPLTASLSAAPGDTVRLDLRFPYHYAVQSVPYGASVYAVTAEGRRWLGETPLVHEQATPLVGTLRVERPAYAAETLEPRDDVWNRFDVVLTPTAPLPEATHEVAWTPPTRRLRWIDYAAAGAAIGAGLLTVHYKFKADRLYDQYEGTTDPALRSDIKAYDTRAAVALGVMQAGVGVFAFRLVLRD